MFADKLRRLRRQRGYTQQNLADLLGVLCSTVARYEQGRQSPRRQDVLSALEKLLGVPMEYLLEDIQDDDLDEENSGIEDLIIEIKAKLAQRGLLR